MRFERVAEKNELIGERLIASSLSASIDVFIVKFKISKITKMPRRSTITREG